MLSKPRILLHLEGALVLALSVLVYHQLHASWLTFAILFLAPDLFMLGYLGLAISIAPYLVPPTITFWDAAAAPASQIFMLLGTLLLLPMIIGYVVFIYWLFRGKVREGESYH